MVPSNPYTNRGEIEGTAQPSTLSERTYTPPTPGLTSQGSYAIVSSQLFYAVVSMECTLVLDAICMG